MRKERDGCAKKENTLIDNTCDFLFVENSFILNNRKFWQRTVFLGDFNKFFDTISFCLKEVWGK